MSKIDELIEQLCPDGVEFKKLGEVGIITIGEFVHKNKQDVNAIYPVYNGGTSYTGFYSEFNNTANKIVISARGANAGFVNRVLVDYWAGNSCYSISFKDVSYVDWRFAFYYLKHHENTLIGDQQRGGIPAVSKKMVEQFQIPVPPLEIQNEIVSILDKFTLLEAELEAELEARKTQYEHYRDALLSFETKNVEWKTLGEISKSVTSGGTPLSNKSEYYSNGTIPWLRTQEVRFNEIHSTEIKITDLALKQSSAKWIPANCVIVAISGATAGRSAINKIPLTTNQHCCNLNIDPSQAQYRYVFHWVSSRYEQLKSLGQGARADLNSSRIKSFPIPIPSLSEQERIINILDKFDALVNDISIGLPAEIEARRKQYEYYRNRLLNFKNVSNG